MNASITITLPLHPTDAELRTAREIIALLRAASPNTDKARNGEETVEQPVAPPPSAAEVFGGSRVATVPPAGGPAVPATFQVDSTGLPWDARIHSESKKTNNDGSWKKRRGVQDSEVTRLEAEIRATLPLAGSRIVGYEVVPQATVAPPPPAAQSLAPSPGEAIVAPPPSPGEAIVAPPPPVTQAAPVAGVPLPPSTAPVTTFSALITKIAALIPTGAVMKEDLEHAVRSVGLTTTTQIPSRQDLIPAINGYIDAVVEARAAGAPTTPDHIAAVVAMKNLGV